MKARIYMSTLLALTIQVMVNGQTPGNQIHQFRMDIMGMQRPAEKAAVSFGTSAVNPELAMLIGQTQELSATAQKLREEAKQAEHQLLLKHIEISGLSARINYEKFDQNKAAIAELLGSINQESYTYANAESMDEAAGHFIKTAKEMREEANAQLTDEAKYGDMTNAEEFELLALNKQQEIFDLLKQAGNESIRAIVKLQAASVNTDSNIADADQVRLQEALKQAGDLKATAGELRAAAITKEGNEKAMMLAEAKGMDQDYILKQIEASGLSAAMHYKTFSENRELIAGMTAEIKDNEALSARLESLSEQAERFLRMGREMREEANAQFTIAARYGDMSNAEEEETLALNAQQQALAMLGHGNQAIASR